MQVEPLWIQAGKNGWNKVEQAIDATFEGHSRMMIESLGAGQEFGRLRTVLEKKYRPKLIRVYADLDTCLRRVRNRDGADHIPGSDDQIEQYNKIAANVV